MIDLTPDQFRTLGYRAVDLIAEQLAALPAAPCRRVMPDALRQSLLDQPLPAVMRFVKAQGSIRARGFQDEAAPMVVYTSAQGHSCIEKEV